MAVYGVYQMGYVQALAGTQIVLRVTCRAQYLNHEVLRQAFCFDG